ncbi:thioredoxin domain-containing protein 3 homolog [Pollicipes pollicipes]|uniref:thioredoxin domain-containing protein 3 homolog n=1 Tax=Pollicipes pollicipes TaxID=41117 RepID=UPI00188563A2|nr:thioredoxin domain-containing protein 3 homolog [Pollicipes pollicipes]
MARKRDLIQIQTDVTTQEEWEQEISKPGLTVVDVYPAWCGPCVSMLGMLKKIKFELGDDMLHFVTARSDAIDALEAFRGRCEPLWIFYGSGNAVYQLRGAHLPLLASKILEELDIEKKVRRGRSGSASPITLECDAPAEVELPEVPVVEDEAETAAALNARRQRSSCALRRALAPQEEIQAVLDARGFTSGAETCAVLSEEEVDALLGPPCGSTFPELYRAAPAPPTEQVAFVIFPASREEAPQLLVDAGFRVLHSGSDALIEEVAEQLVPAWRAARARSQSWLAEPVYAAALGAPADAALSAMVNMDPLYLSDGPYVVCQYKLSGSPV